MVRVPVCLACDACDRLCGACVRELHVMSEREGKAVRAAIVAAQIAEAKRRMTVPYGRGGAQ